jgi:hypothetical protein
MEMGQIGRNEKTAASGLAAVGHGFLVRDAAQAGGAPLVVRLRDARAANAGVPWQQANAR